MALYSSWLKKVKAGAAAADQQPYTDAAAYRAALERAAYSDAGSQYGAGLGRISNYLAGAGPNADSGAANAYRARLASDIYGGASRDVLGGYASYLGNALQSRRNYLYQLALLKQQKKMQQTGFGGFLGGIAGSIGGPFLGAVGKGLGEKLID